ncbi:MAG: hypothetical protein AAF743_16105, partial [Planctomycetota bacterium]
DYEDKYTKPKLRAKIKEELKASDKGGKPGEWSARKSQLLVQEYEKQGGGYKNDGKLTDNQKSLKRWTEEDWQTIDGEANADLPDGGKKRYLPEKAWDLLSEEEKKKTAKKKRDEGADGAKQFVANTVAAKAARKFVSHGDASDLTADQLERLTKDELYEIAKDEDIDGRSSMNKPELAASIAEQT